MKKISLALIAAFIFNTLPLSLPALAIETGDVIKRAGSSALYYIGEDGKRHAFPSGTIYNSWYADFSSVQTVSSDELLSYTLGPNVTLRPGTQLIQAVTNDTPWVVSDPKVYAVSNGQVLRHISTAEVAVSLYGSNWESMIVPVVETVFTNYSAGDPITTAADFSRQTVTATADTINAELTFDSTPTPTSEPEPEPEPTPEPGPVVVPTNWPHFSVSHSLIQLKQPTVVALDEGFALSYLGEKSANQFDIYYSTFNIAGSQTLNPVSPVPNTNSVSEAVMSRGGDNLLVAWVGQNDQSEITLSTARIDVAGNLISGPNVVLADKFVVSPNNLALVYNGKNFGLVWSAQETDQPYKHIYFLLLDPNGAALRPINKITDRNEDSVEPDLTWNGSSFGIVWTSKNETASNIYLIPVDDLGEKSLVMLETKLSGSTFNFPGQPSVTGHDNEFGVGWYGFVSASGGQRQQIIFERRSDNLTNYLDDYELTQYDQGFDGFEPQAIWTEPYNTIIWRRDGSEIFMTRLADDFSLNRDEFSLGQSTNIRDLSVGFDNAIFAIAWTGDNGQGQSQIYYTLGK